MRSREGHDIVTERNERPRGHRHLPSDGTDSIRSGTTASLDFEADGKRSGRRRRETSRPPRSRSVSASAAQRSLSIVVSFR
ncbi:hypothetical protein BRC68_11755 [Halobacteriales archaeon QH_6_64_20]|nr:MAG: hypothetical protein BRC68_11755 [Halobacteriales archaeon QH_6_64_20]